MLYSALPKVAVDVVGVMALLLQYTHQQWSVCGDGLRRST
jgi:hypothetical protein